MFALGALWAAAVPWLGPPAGSAIAPGRWHAHEMIVGVMGALAAGYHPAGSVHWSGVAAPAGRALAALAALWLAGRGAMMAPPAALPAGAAITVAAAFPAMLTVMMGRRVLSGRAWARAGVPMGFALLTAGGAALAAGAAPATGGLMAVLALGALFARIHGRILPAFTVTALKGEALPGPTPRPAPMRGALTPALIALALTALAMGLMRLAAAALIAAGAALILMQAGWRPDAGRRDGLLAMMHLSHLWLAAGLIATGAALIRPDLLAPGAALHAIAIGALGGSGYAIAARAPARADGAGRLRPGAGLTAGFALIMAASAARLTGWTVPAGALWSAGWLSFVAAMVMAGRIPHPGPVFSGRRP